MKAVVLGGGPGGYVCAIRLAQNGADVTLVEKEHLGGTCLNEGCIPTKALLHSADLYEKVLKEAAMVGIKVEGASLDWKTVQKHRGDVVNQLVGGVKGLLAANKVKVINGFGTIKDKKTLSVDCGGKTEEIGFDALVIAAGSAPKMIPIPGIDLPGVISSTEALTLEEVPERFVIIGGGVIGSEIASAYASFGSKVTILEALPDMLNGIDPAAVKVVLDRMHKNGIETYTKAAVKEIKKNGDALEVVYNDTSVPADKVLVATGRYPLTKNIGLENAGVKEERGYIKVNFETMESNVPGIYAIGDCCGGVQLAHAASAEGIIAADVICGKEPGVNMKTIPACVYTAPEIGCAGMNEQQAKEAGYDVSTGTFPLVGNGKAIIEGDTSGFVKITADRKTGELLGVCICGPRATDMIAESVLAINLECTVEELVSSIHEHPTVSEAVQEAAHSVFGNPIHMPPIR